MELTAKELGEEKEMAVEFLSSAWLNDHQGVRGSLNIEESKSRL